MKRKQIAGVLMPLLALVGMANAPPVQADVQYLSVRWAGSSQSIALGVTGTSLESAPIAPASGHLDGVLDNMDTVPGQTLSRIFCCDLFQQATAGTPEANLEWDVTRYTEADGTTGWVTPSSGTDSWRDPNGLRRTAFLANKWGRGTWLSTGSATERQEKAISLNVAIWQASYGSRFSLYNGDGGLTASELGYYGLYMADYNAGREATRYAWYDNGADDQTDRRQDFIEPVPEPGTILLLGSGLLASGFAFIRRRT